MSTPNAVPSLAEVAAEFTRWRQTRTSPRTPAALQQKAVALLSQHRVSEVMKALGVYHKGLKRWKQKWSSETAALPAPTAAAPFIVLPTLAQDSVGSASAVALKLTHRRGDGSALSIEAELDEVHWRWALELLHTPVAS
jgi:hypothetical protein